MFRLLILPTLFRLIPMHLIFYESQSLISRVNLYSQKRKRGGLHLDKLDPVLSLDYLESRKFLQASSLRRCSTGQRQ